MYTSTSESATKQRYLVQDPATIWPRTCWELCLQYANQYRAHYVLLPCF